MARLKSHPVFTITVSLLLAVALGAAVLLYLSLGKVSAAAREVEQKAQTLSGYTQRAPFPSQANLDAVTAEVARARELLATMQAALKGRGEYAARVQNAALPVGPTEAYFDVANFVEAMRTAATEAEITIPAGTRFGFSSHASTGPEREIIPQVHRQRLVAEYLLKTLFAAAPQELVSLQRNRPVAPGKTVQVAPTSKGKTSAATGPESDFFDLDPRMTAAVPGFVETTAFKVSFIGYSSALRKFLNEIASFDLPLVVRSVEVESVSGTQQSKEKSPASAANALGALFGTTTTTAPAADTVKPIVEQVRSRFTVTIEYINMVEAASDDTQPTS